MAAGTQAGRPGQLPGPARCPTPARWRTGVAPTFPASTCAATYVAAGEIDPKSPLRGRAGSAPVKAGPWSCSKAGEPPSPTLAAGACRAGGDRLQPRDRRPRASPSWSRSTSTTRSCPPRRVSSPPSTPPSGVAASSCTSLAGSPLACRSGPPARRQASTARRRSCRAAWWSSTRAHRWSTPMSTRRRGPPPVTSSAAPSPR